MTGLFTVVKNLYISVFIPRTTPALQELVRGVTTELSPTIHSLFWEQVQSSGPALEVIGDCHCATLLLSPYICFAFRKIVDVMGDCL